MASYVANEGYEVSRAAKRKARRASVVRQYPVMRPHAAHPSPVAAPAVFVTNIVLGAAAGLLWVLGAGRFSEGVAAQGGFGAPMDAIASAFAQSGAPGAIELLGAVTLTLNNHWCIGRILGLLGFLTIAMLHETGADAGSFLEPAGRVYASLMQFATFMRDGGGSA